LKGQRGKKLKKVLLRERAQNIVKSERYRGEDDGSVLRNEVPRQRFLRTLTAGRSALKSDALKNEMNQPLRLFSKGVGQGRKSA